MCEVQSLVMYGPMGEAKTIETCNKVENWTVGQLKEAAGMKFPGVGNVRPTYQGKTLEDDATLLSKYGIRSMSVIHLVFKVHGG